MKAAVEARTKELPPGYNATEVVVLQPNQEGLAVIHLVGAAAGKQAGGLWCASACLSN